MKTKINLVLILALIANINTAMGDVSPDYAAIFKRHLQFPSCIHNYDGVFESTSDGCFQVEANLVWRTPSTGDTDQPIAQKFCQTVDRLAGRKGQALGWRLPTLKELEELHSDLQFVARSSGLALDQNANTGLGILPFDLTQPMWIDGVDQKRGYLSNNIEGGMINVEFGRSFNLAQGGIAANGPTKPQNTQLMVDESGGFKYYPLKTVVRARALCVRTATPSEVPTGKPEELEPEIPMPKDGPAIAPKVIRPNEGPAKKRSDLK